MRSFGYRRRRLLLTGAAVKLVDEESPHSAQTPVHCARSGILTF